MSEAIKRLLAFSVAAALLFLAGCSGVPAFDGKALASGKVGMEYQDSVAAGNGDMYYDLDAGSSLPKGLVLYDNGDIKGYPVEAGEFSFKLVMVDLEDNEYFADFTMYIEGGSLTYTAGAIPNGKTGEPYQQNLGTATGMDTIVYAVKEGTKLPAGLSLSKDGMLSGIPTEAGKNFTFTVVASAQGCENVEAEYTLSIEQGAEVSENEGKIIFESFTLPEATVGEPYSESIRLAYGVPNITYAFRFSSGKGLPSGLSADKELGMISGTPTDCTDGEITFRVIASAEGYESVTAYVTMSVKDKYVTTTRFETEYVDMIPELTGNGYSDSKTGRGMIQNTPLTSNGKILGYMNKPTDVTFTIYADETTSATLVLGLGSEVGDFTYDPSMFAIIVNGVEIDYGTINVKQIGDSEATYETQAHTITPIIDLVAGENTITFSIKASDKATGTFSAVGCLFDYIELLNASCDLGWYARVGNVQ